MGNNNHLESLYTQGKSFYNSKSYDKAKECFYNCIQSGDKQTYSLNGLANYNSKLMLARIFRIENNIVETIKEYIEAVFDPNNPNRIGLQETKQYLKENNQIDILNELNTLTISNNSQQSLIQLFKGNQEYYMDYPKEVHIETTGRCNASCVFCNGCSYD